MKDVKQTIANNLVAFRKANKLTQLELAEKVGYSDKAVSRWEHGEVTPDVETLARLADVYNVDVAVFFDEDVNPESEKRLKLQIGNKLTIALLSIVTLWSVVIMSYVYANVISGLHLWRLFILAVPLSCILGIIFNAIWGKRVFTFILISLFLWSTLTFIYLYLINYNIWILFILGVPLQIAIILCANLKSVKKI